MDVGVTSDVTIDRADELARRQNYISTRMAQKLGLEKDRFRSDLMNTLSDRMDYWESYLTRDNQLIPSARLQYAEEFDRCVSFQSLHGSH